MEFKIYQASFVLNDFHRQATDVLDPTPPTPPTIWKTVSGNPIQILDALASPMQKCEVSLEPIQDLHGQDAPYPAGGGKNLGNFANNYGVDSSGYVVPTQGRIATIDAIPIEGGKSYKFYLTGNANGICAVWNGETLVRRYIGISNGSTINTDGGDRFYMAAYDDVTVEDNKPMVLLSTETDTSYHPYSNICPITGWTGCEVTRCGENLLNNVSPVVLNAYFNTSTVSSQNNNQRIVVIPCNKSTAYTFTWNRVAISGTQNARICTFAELPTYGSVGTLKVENVAESESESFTTGTNDIYIAIHFGDIRTTDFSASLTASMLNTGSSASPYKPYSGTTLSVTFSNNLFNPALIIEKYFIRAGNTTAQSPLGTAVQNNSFDCSDYVPVTPNTTYTINVPYYYAAGGAGLVFFSTAEVSGAISGVPTATQGSYTYTFTTPENCNYIRFSWGRSGTQNEGYPLPQLELGTGSAYKPYNNTVYGGTVDLVSGVLTVDRLYYEVDGTTNYFVLAGNYANIKPYEVVDGINTTLSTWLCNTFRTNTYNVGYNAGAKFVYLNKGAWERIGSTSEELNAYAAIHPIQFVFPLNEPITISLTPQEISTLNGENNVWGSGDIELTYLGLE